MKSRIRRIERASRHLWILELEKSGEVVAVERVSLWVRVEVA
jgi:hypothetical protein